jgi:hypothetical protein
MYANWSGFVGFFQERDGGKKGLSVLIFKSGRHGGHEKTREGPEHGNKGITSTF